MPEQAKDLEKRNLHDADEVRIADRARIEVVRLGGTTVMRATFQPGWRWSQDIKPVVGTESCEAKHLIYAISGRMRVRMNSGEEVLIEPGDVVSVAPGHDAWVVGDEPVVSLDLYAGETYAKGATVEVKRAA